MIIENTLTIHHAKIRLLAGPLTEEEDTELWTQILLNQEPLTRWFREIGVELVIHGDYGVALVRQMADIQREQAAANAGKAVLPPVLKSRALSYFESQALTYLHEKLNIAVSTGNHDLILLRSEFDSAINNLQPAAQRNNEAGIIRRIDTALDKFERYGLLHKTDLGGKPAVKPDIILLVMLPRDELERFNKVVESLVNQDDGDAEPADEDEVAAYKEAGPDDDES